MKRYFLAFVFLIPTLCLGQLFVGEVNINAIDSIKIIEVYIDREPALLKFVNVYVDYGQKDSFYSQNLSKQTDNRIVDPVTKKKVVFKSTAAVLNLFEKNNWEYFDGFAVRRSDSAGFYYYFRKKE